MTNKYSFEEDKATGVLHRYTFGKDKVLATEPEIELFYQINDLVEKVTMMEIFMKSWREEWQKCFIENNNYDPFGGTELELVKLDGENKS